MPRNTATWSGRPFSPRPTSEGDPLAAAGAQHPLPVELRAFAELEDLPGVEEIRLVGDGLRVAFPEADFVITVSSPSADAPCETEWEVTVREPTPGLSTWWGRWHRSYSVSRSAVGPLIVHELRGTLSRVQGMLDDHAHGSREIPQEA